MTVAAVVAAVARGVLPIVDAGTPAQVAYIKVLRGCAAWFPLTFMVMQASNTGLDDQFGLAVASNADGEWAGAEADWRGPLTPGVAGTTIAIGAPNEDSGASGVNGDETSNAVQGSGAGGCCGLYSLAL